MLKEKINLFKAKGFIEPKANIATGQKMLHYSYRGNRLMDIATKIMEELVASNYGFYLATVRKENIPSFYFFKKNNFILLDEDNERYYFINRIVSRNIPLHVQNEIIGASGEKHSVLIRPAAHGDEIQMYDLNKEWIKENKAEDLSRGFLTTLYSPDDFRMMIEQNEVVVIWSH